MVSKSKAGLLKKVKKYRSDIKNKSNKIGKNTIDVDDKSSIIERVKIFIKEKKLNLIYLILLILDIGLIIWCAKDNYANYANVDGKSYFIGKTRHLLFGRNYVGLIITGFIYFYSILINKFIMKKKSTIKMLIVVLLGLLVFNMLLFYIFTNKIY